MESLNQAPFILPEIAYQHQRVFLYFCVFANALKQTFAILRGIAYHHQQTFAILPDIAQKQLGNIKTGMVKPTRTFAQSILPRLAEQKPQTRISRLLRYCLALPPKGGDNYQAIL